MTWKGQPSQIAYIGFYLVCAVFCWLVFPLIFALLKYRSTSGIEYYIDQKGVGIWNPRRARDNRFLEHERIASVEVVDKGGGLKEVSFLPSQEHLPAIVFQQVNLSDEMINTYRQELKARQSKSRIKSIAIPVLQ